MLFLNLECLIKIRFMSSMFYCLCHVKTVYFKFLFVVIWYNKFLNMSPPF